MNRVMNPDQTPRALAALAAYCEGDNAALGDIFADIEPNHEISHLEHSSAEPPLASKDSDPAASVGNRDRFRSAARVAAVVIAAGTALTALYVRSDSPVQMLTHPAVEKHSPTKRTCETVIAQKGDNLWLIARKYQPEGEVRPLVDELAQQLPDDRSILFAGDSLRVCVDQ